MCDDDSLVPCGLQRCIAWRDDNPMFSARAGRETQVSTRSFFMHNALVGLRAGQPECGLKRESVEHMVEHRED